MSKVRVRIAPSPTGYPHIGTIFQALINYAYAKKHHGDFLVRIEDTDQSRFVEDAEDAIFSYAGIQKLFNYSIPERTGTAGY